MALRTKKAPVEPLPTHDYIAACRVHDARSLTADEAQTMDRLTSEFWGLQLALRAGAKALQAVARKLRDESEETVEPHLFDEAEEELRRAQRADDEASNLLYFHDTRAAAWTSYKKSKAKK